MENILQQKYGNQVQIKWKQTKTKQGNFLVQDQVDLKKLKKFRQLEADRVKEVIKNNKLLNKKKRNLIKKRIFGK
jgi:hypothetical protein